VTQPSSHWIEIFLAVGVPCGPVNTYEEALDEPQVRSMGWVKELHLPSGKTTHTFCSPFMVDGETLPIRRPPPELGQHNEEVLSELRMPSLFGKD